MNPTEINQELNSIQDGNELQNRIVELSYDGIKLEDMDETLFKEILRGYIDGVDNYLYHSKKIKNLEESAECLKTNLSCTSSKLSTLEKENETLKGEAYQKSIRIDELQSTLQAFQRLIHRFC